MRWRGGWFGRGARWWFLDPYLWGAYGGPVYSLYGGYGAYPPFPTPYWSRMYPSYPYYW